MKRYIEPIVLITILTIYGLATYQRNFLWKDDMTLWSDIVRKSPYEARAHNNLGLAYFHNKAYLQGIAHFKEALHLNPYFSYAHYNLGIAYQKIGLYEKAITEYKKALYGTREPYFADIHNNLGVCYFTKGWRDMAIKEFKQALSIDPHFSNARYNLDVALELTKKEGKGGANPLPSCTY